MGGSILNMLFKGIFESNAGKLRWQPNMWAIVGSKWDRKRIQNKHLSGRGYPKGELFEDDGKIVLVKRTCTTNCPNPPGDHFYVDDKGKAWVPQTECRKCPYFAKSSRQYRFSRCTFKEQSDQKTVLQKSTQEFCSIVSGAMKKTNDIIGGRD